MKPNTHLDDKINLAINKLGLPVFDLKTNKVFYELIGSIEKEILELEQTQSSRHDWSILVDDIKKYFNP